MRRAQSPEELETLFEDAFVSGDREAVAELFEDRGVLGVALGQARGAKQIAHLVAAMLDGDYSYVAEPQRVIQARDTVLVITRQGINVARRGSDGGWLYAISLLDTSPTTGGDR